MVEHDCGRARRAGVRRDDAGALDGGAVERAAARQIAAEHRGDERLVAGRDDLDDVVVAARRAGGEDGGEHEGRGEAHGRRW